VTTIQPVRPQSSYLARRYALVELFLVRVLDMGPDEAPAEADVLQHAVSERLLARIDAVLGRPERDLRGGRIPRQDGWP
jgi:DtxR family Mn-dependent transcriptional regulator